VSDWPADDIATLAQGDELRIASYRPDGSLRPWVRIWFVQVRDGLYVRSAYGPENGWYRRAKASGTGRIKVKGHERDVAFETPDTSLNEAVTDAYRDKYDRYPAKIVATVVNDDAVRSTLRVVPR
jgi:hypothetical protein